MSTHTQPGGQPGGGPSGAATSGPSGGSGQPSEEELRAAYEAELSRVTSADMILQAAASLLNIGAFRLGLTGGAGGAGAGGAGAGGAGGGEDGTGRHGQQDLEQVRDAIDAVRGLLPVIERRAPADLRPLRDALSQLQLAYTRAVSAAQGAAGVDAGAQGERPAQPGAPVAPPPGEQPATPGAAQPEQQPSQPGPGPAEASGRLWVPGR